MQGLNTSRLPLDRSKSGGKKSCITSSCWGVRGIGIFVTPFRILKIERGYESDDPSKNCHGQELTVERKLIGARLGR